MNNILDAIEKRSSTRGYTAEKLTDAELERLLKAGLQAPTAANKQEIHISVLDGDNPILAEIEAEKNALMNVQSPPANFYYSAPLVMPKRRQKFPLERSGCRYRGGEHRSCRRGAGAGQRNYRHNQRRDVRRKDGVFCQGAEFSGKL